MDAGDGWQLGLGIHGANNHQKGSTDSELGVSTSAVSASARSPRTSVSPRYVNLFSFPSVPTPEEAQQEWKDGTNEFHEAATFRLSGDEDQDSPRRVVMWVQETWLMCSTTRCSPSSF